MYYTHIENGANGASNANQLYMPSLEVSVSRVSILVAVGGQRNSDIVKRFGTVGDCASALDFTTIAGFFLVLAGVRRQDTGRSHWGRVCMSVGYRRFHSFCGVCNWASRITVSRNAIGVYSGPRERTRSARIYAHPAKRDGKQLYVAASDPFSV